jgi:hypothetical protein
MAAHQTAVAARVRSALVVEDDEDIARILEFMLERDGFG